jgi:hypothetical protein
VPGFETPGPVSLDVALPSGDVRVETWSEPRVEVQVTPLRGDDVSREAAAATRVEAAERGGRHEVTVHVPKRDGRLASLFGRGPELLVEIRCPEGSELALTTHSADLQAHGPLGVVNARSASGDAQLGPTGDLSFTTASGDLLAGSVDGTLNVKSASGDVAVRSVAAASTVSTVSGDVVLGETAETAAVNTVSGDVELRAAEGGVRVSAVSGDVHVAARPGLSLWIDAQSVSGSVTSELDVGDDAEGDGAPAELRIRTVSGDVRISRARP